MAAHVLVNWTNRTVEELNPTDIIEAYIQGLEIGRDGADVALWQVDVSPPVQRYPRPEHEMLAAPEPESEPVST